MKVELRKIEKSDREVVYNLFNLYLYDMSEHMKWKANSNGKFDFDKSILDCY